LKIIRITISSDDDVLAAAIAIIMMSNSINDNRNRKISYYSCKPVWTLITPLAFTLDPKRA
jgi:hypothetical protein